MTVTTGCSDGTVGSFLLATNTERIVSFVVTTVDSVLSGVQQLAHEWKHQRAERQARRELVRADFDALRETGFLRLIAPLDDGGLWSGAATSARPIADALRCLAGADPAVALVSAMHPAVIAFWLFSPDPIESTWAAQRRAVFASAVAGERWGTITSEPGSGGDIGRTKAIAEPSDHAPFMPGETYVVTGDKHFGSGSGIVDRMITTALPEGSTEPTIFAMDVRDRPWDGSAGWTITAPWDGVGMAATQSHGMRLERMPAVRLARPGALAEVTAHAGAFVATLFTAVVVGVLDEAVAYAKTQLAPRAAQLRAFEQVEWTRSVNEHWLAVHAYEGALRAIEGADQSALLSALFAKEGVAELGESVMSRLARVVGGGSFSRRSPLAHWYEDVRALGFLRPPWGLAFDNLFTLSFA